MAMSPAPFWTDLYYHVVEYYFWRPQLIGRKALPGVPAKAWPEWERGLRGQEIPLNHILDFLFYVSPPVLLDRVVTALTGRTFEGLALSAAGPGVLDVHVVQPDMILTNGKQLVLIEMKVDSKSSVDQLVKYAIGAHCMMQDHPEIDSVDLVLLSRTTDHNRAWKNQKALGIVDESSLRAAAVRRLTGDDSIGAKGGIQRFKRLRPDAFQEVGTTLEAMKLHLVNYDSLAAALRQFAAQEHTLSRLIDGVLHEFQERKLVQT